MKTQRILILFLGIVVAAVLLAFSTWHQWNVNQGTILERMRPIPPVAEFNHGSWIQSIAFSPTNPNFVASASEGNEVKVWNKNNPEAPELTLTGHTDKSGRVSTFVDCLAFSPTGEWLASKTFQTLDLWNIPSGTELNSSEIRSFTANISPTSPLLATALRDVRLWNISNPKEITEMYVLPPKMEAQALSHEEGDTVKHHNDTINQQYKNVAFSHDSKWIAAAGQIYDQNRKRWADKAKVWDLQSKQLFRIIEREIPKDLEPKKYHRDFRSIKFSPDNRFFAIAGETGLTIWSLPEWTIYHQKLDQKIFDAAFSPDGKMYAVADKNKRQVILWTLESMRPIAVLKPKYFLAHVDVITFSPDGNTLAGAGFDGVLRLWDVRKLNER